MENRPIPPQNQAPNTELPQPDLQDLQTARHLLLAAAILCPVSIFFGIIFSIASVVCALMALVKVVKLASNSEGEIQIAAKRMQTIIIICFGLCVAIMILNIVAIVVMFPVVLEAVQTGDYSALGLDAATLENLSSGDSSNDGSKTWG